MIDGKKLEMSQKLAIYELMNAKLKQANIDLEQQLADLREVANEAKDLLSQMRDIQPYSDDVHYVGGMLNAALNNDKDRVGE